MIQPKIILYSKERCPLCDEVKAWLDLLCEAHDLSYKEIDIYSDDALLEQYQLMIPVVAVDGEVAAAGRISYQEIEKTLMPYIKK
nr:glutaredoxin family protein [Pullulanibacillus camelliae]